MTHPPPVEDVLDRWHRVARAWLRADDGTALLAEVLEHGPEVVLDDGEREAPTPAELLACEVALVRLSGAVDEDGYRHAVRPPLVGAFDPVHDYCARGWRAVDNPSLDLDTWWYWTEHLDPTRETINPLLHFLLVGRRLGLSTLPVFREAAPPGVLPADCPVRRACLFAAYDAQGTVPDTTVAYVAELARHAEVFYLADCEIHPDELAKLDGITAGAWARRHGAYDFGSYATLARDLVGWDTLETYDEVLLVNDSAYLLRPLDDVLARMGTRACDWWGLQLTSRRLPEPLRDDPAPLVEDVLAHVPRSVLSYDAFPHVGSYFLALRRAALDDPGLRRRLDAVVPQATKAGVVNKYETGTSFYLLGRGFALATFLPRVHPFHPVYSAGAFDRLGEGFPVLKRGLLAENPFTVPGLDRWKERVLEQLPDAPVLAVEADLVRVTDADTLARSFAVRTRPDGTLQAPLPRTRERDESTPTYPHWWVFPVCAYDHTLSGNERAVFEQVKDDPSIKKIVLTLSRPVDVGGENVVVAPLYSVGGLRHALRAGVVFVKHAPGLNLPYGLSPDRHAFVNLWHGIPLKRFGTAAHITPEQRHSLEAIHRASRAVVTSSAIDTLAMTAAFAPLTAADMWPTGLPRNDFVVREEDRLPEDLQHALRTLREELDGRRLLLFLPTFKDGQGDSYYRFSEEQVDRLGRWCREHDAVIGVREHMADSAHTYSTMLAPLAPLDLSSRRYRDVEVLYRAADALVTDYSSCLVDFLLTGKPVISFAYDLERYANEERGLFYDLDEAVPGPVCRDFEALHEGLEHVFDEPSPAQREEYAWRRARFFDHLDDHNARRVVQRVRDLVAT